MAEVIRTIVSEEPEIKEEPKPESSSNAGLIVLALKLSGKVIPILAKLWKAAWGALKGLLGLKTAGAAASLGLYSYLFTWQMGIALVAFIFIHEYGHYWAMKKCGIKTKGIYLIPGFGGAAVAEERFKSGGKQFIIAIMGPLFGLIPLAILIGAYVITHNPIYAALASILAFINLLNLFPINPLDGGRVIVSFMYAFHDAVGFIFMVACFFASIIIGVWTGLTLLAVIAFMGFYEAIYEYGLEKQLRRFNRSVLRIFIAGVVYLGIILIFRSSGWLLQSVGVLFIIFATVALVLDVLSTTRPKPVVSIDPNKDHLPEMIVGIRQDPHFPLYHYPWLLAKDMVYGIEEFFKLRPSGLKRVENYEPMPHKYLPLAIAAYVLTIGLMVTIMLYASKIPGCELALEMLK
jgi:Zn-dependent protease